MAYDKRNQQDSHVQNALSLQTRYRLSNGYKYEIEIL